MKNPQEEIELTEYDIEDIEELTEDLLEEDVEEPSLEDLVKRGESEIKKANKVAKEIEQKGDNRAETVAENIAVSPKKIEKVKEEINFEERKAGIMSKIKALVAETKGKIRQLLGEKKEEEFRMLDKQRGYYLEKEQVDEKIKISALQLELRKTIEENPHIAEEEISNFIEEKTNKLKLSSDQKDFFENLIRKYQDKREKLIKNREKYHNDKEFFEACFGFTPKGKIEISEGPLSFYMRCKEADFVNARAVGQESTGKKLDKRARKDLGLATGDSNPMVLLPELNGLVILENANVKDPKRTRIHEEQHKYYQLFDQRSLRKDKLDVSDTDMKGKEKQDIVLEHLRFKRETGILEPFVKDEILAYYRAGTNLNSTLEKLLKRQSKGGLYDYFATLKKPFTMRLESYGVKNEDSEPAMEKVFGKEYDVILKGAVDAIRDLESIGMEREQIVEFLITEPIEQWPDISYNVKQEKADK